MAFGAYTDLAFEPRKRCRTRFYRLLLVTDRFVLILESVLSSTFADLHCARSGVGEKRDSDQLFLAIHLSLETLGLLLGRV